MKTHQGHRKRTSKHKSKKLQPTPDTTLRTQDTQKQTTQDKAKTVESQAPKQMLTIMTSDPRQSDEESAPLKVTYYNWHRIHKIWLNDIMKEKLGVKEGL